MKHYLGVSIIALALSFPLAAMAQDEEAPAETYFYATYFYCKVHAQERADELVKAHTVPIYDAAVADGTIQGWGWLAHQTGGKWRRLMYHISDSVAGLLAAQKTLGERADAAGGDPDNEFGQICSSHDDYIWKAEIGNTGTAERGTAGLSAYQVCDIGREGRADEIVKEHFAPVYEKAMADGKITSWGWSSHQVGGKYRRLATMSGNSFAEVLAARGEIIEAIYGDGNNAAANEYSSICNSHADYLWEIQHEKR